MAGSSPCCGLCFSLILACVGGSDRAQRRPRMDGAVSKHTGRHPSIQGVFQVYRTPYKHTRHRPSIQAGRHSSMQGAIQACRHHLSIQCTIQAYRLSAIQACRVPSKHTGHHPSIQAGRHLGIQGTFQACRARVAISSGRNLFYPGQWTKRGRKWKKLVYSGKNRMKHFAIMISRIFQN